MVTHSPATARGLKILVAGTRVLCKLSSSGSRHSNLYYGFLKSCRSFSTLETRQFIAGKRKRISWGGRRSLKLIDDLIEMYQPSVVVVEDYVAKGSRRCGRVRELINEISKLGANRNVKVRRFSRLKVKQAFSESGASNKYEIAIAIAKHFPELVPRLPRFRKPWMSEDYRRSIFDAAGLELTFFCIDNKRKLEA